MVHSLHFISRLCHFPRMSLCVSDMLHFMLQIRCNILFSLQWLPLSKMFRQSKCLHIKQGDIHINENQYLLFSILIQCCILVNNVIWWARCLSAESTIDYFQAESLQTAFPNHWIIEFSPYPWLYLSFSFFFFSSHVWLPSLCYKIPSISLERNIMKCSIINMATHSSLMKMWARRLK